VTITVFSAETAIGRLRCAATEDGVALISFPGSDHERDLHRLSERGETRARRHPAARQLVDWCAGRRTELDMPLDLRLVRGFTGAALEALRDVPFGALVTYGELAARAGSPRAFRAVGRAMGANPLPLVIP
jgi:methylated-DNA-[protein]-cysteine S-methyltransferase